MTLSMYSASVPAFRRYLTSLSGVLAKGAAFAEARKIDPAVLLQSRLAPDMFSLVGQVQRVSDNAKGGIARLAAVEAPKFADEETTFPEALDRIALTLDFIGSVPVEKFDGSETREIVLTMRAHEVRFTGQDYLFNFVFPNVLFHCTTAYAILRHNGVEIGKRDFLGVA
jgi:uncharacterized protein